MPKIFQITVIEPLETTYFVVANETPNINILSKLSANNPSFSTGRFITSIYEVEGGEIIKGEKNEYKL